MVFLNSTFGIWMLSTIAVGLITLAYAQWTESKKVASLNKQYINKIDAELSSSVRISAFRYADK